MYEFCACERAIQIKFSKNHLNYIEFSIIFFVYTMAWHGTSRMLDQSIKIMFMRIIIILVIC